MLYKKKKIKYRKKKKNRYSKLFKELYPQSRFVETKMKIKVKMNLD